MPKKPEVADAQDYINKAVPEAQPILRELRELILTTLPEAEEKISWGQPFYVWNKKKASIAAYKAHVSLSISDDLTEAVHLEAEKQQYETGQKRLNIPFQQAVPEALVRDILSIITK